MHCQGGHVRWPRQHDLSSADLLEQVVAFRRGLSTADQCSDPDGGGVRQEKRMEAFPRRGHRAARAVNASAGKPWSRGHGAAGYLPKTGLSSLVQSGGLLFQSNSETVLPDFPWPP